MTEKKEPSFAYEVLTEELLKCLPKTDLPFNVLFYKTNPVKCRRPLIYRKPPKKTRPKDYNVADDTDYLTTYFVVLTYNNLMIYAIEILVYDYPKHEQTLFVSKADTTGHYGLENADSERSQSLNKDVKPTSTNPNEQSNKDDEIKTEEKEEEEKKFKDIKMNSQPPKVSFAAVTQAILKTIIRCFIDPSRPLHLNLFARAEKHYLFPYSADDKRKHVQTGAELVKWWINVLDNVCAPPTDEDDDNSIIEKVERARLQIPGSEAPRIRSYFPDRQKPYITNKTLTEKELKRRNDFFTWQVGDIFWPDNDPNLAAVRCVPRFFDDPLTRYIEFLAEEKRATKTTQRIFWIELETRQEFRLSIVVGVIGIECKVCEKRSLYKKLNSKKRSNNDNNNNNNNNSDIQSITQWDMKSIHDYITTLDYGDVKMNTAATKMLLQMANIPSKEKRSISLAENDKKEDEEEKSKTRNSESVFKIKSNWGSKLEIYGQYVKQDDGLPKNDNNNNPDGKTSAENIITVTTTDNKPINMLNTGMMVRKKPKRANVTTISSSSPSSFSASNNVTTDKSTNTTQQEGVTTLNSNLIRKKPKLNN